MNNSKKKQQKLNPIIEGGIKSDMLFNPQCAKCEILKRMIEANNRNMNTINMQAAIIDLLRDKNPAGKEIFLN